MCVCVTKNQQSKKDFVFKGCVCVSKVLMYKFMSTSSTLINSGALIDLLLVLIIILPIFKQNLLDDILLQFHFVQQLDKKKKR